MKTFSHWLIDTFESLVDLFSLLSFTLIIATLIYGTSSFDSKQQAVELATLAPGSGQPIALPDDMVVIILKYRNREAVLGIHTSGKPLSQLVVSKQNVKEILEKELIGLVGYEDINIALEKENSEFLSGIFIEILILFDDLGISQYKHYFF